MSEHTAKIIWTRNGEDFVDNKYSRLHQWNFDGGAIVPASSSPHVLRPPMSDPTAVDPEEAFVASISSCHMLWFLSIAAARGFIVDSYEDLAVGLMTKNELDALWISQVTLNPQVKYSGVQQPTPLEMEKLHQKAHEKCFIANSVKTEIIVRSGH